MNIFIEKLKNKVLENKKAGIVDTVIINALKEELQYAVLDFIYNSKQYSSLTMYGGTLLRIAYDLPRMSEDLDFQTEKEFNFEQFHDEIIAHFKNTYEIGVELKTKTERLTGTDVATLNFPNVLSEIGIKGHLLPTVLKIRFDVNNFPDGAGFAKETVAKVKDQYSFSIKTYPVSTLMASKISAVLLRTKRGIGKEEADCKPRDIFDLMWYMEKKIVPNLDYIKAMYKRIGKNFDANNLLELFSIIFKRVMNIDDRLFENDLPQFFYNPAEYQTWFHNWKQRFQFLHDSYEIFQVKKIKDIPELHEIYVATDPSNDNHYLHFFFLIEDKQNHAVKFTVALSEFWFRSSKFRIPEGNRVAAIEKFITGFYQQISNLDYEYVGLFYKKIVDYIQRNNYVIAQKELKTKLIRTEANNLDIKTQIVLDRHLLLREKLEDLF